MSEKVNKTSAKDEDVIVNMNVNPETDVCRICYWGSNSKSPLVVHHESGSGSGSPKFVHKQCLAKAKKLERSNTHFHENTTNTSKERIVWHNPSSMRRRTSNWGRMICVFVTHILFVVCLTSFIRLLVDVVLVDFRNKKFGVVFYLTSTFSVVMSIVLLVVALVPFRHYWTFYKKWQEDRYNSNSKLLAV